MPHRLRSEYLAQLLRHRRPESRISFTVSDALRKSVDNTLALYARNWKYAKRNTEKSAFRFPGKIFIEERIYKDNEFEQAKNMDAACEHIDERLTPYYPPSSAK